MIPLTRSRAATSSARRTGPALPDHPPLDDRARQGAPNRPPRFCGLQSGDVIARYHSDPAAAPRALIVITIATAGIAALTAII